MYDTEFIVKYKSIEEELITKIDNDKEECYTKDEVYSICEELYRHELLKVFQVTDVLGVEMETTMNNIWNIVRLNERFMKVIETYNEKMLVSVNKEECGIHSFIMLFNYDLFFLLHPCICQFIQNQEVDDSLLDKLIEKINLI